MIAHASAADFFYPEDFARCLGTYFSTENALELVARQKRELARGRAPEVARAQTKPGRNDPCPCGSGKKSKRCCALAAIGVGRARC